MDRYLTERDVWAVSPEVCEHRNKMMFALGNRCGHTMRGIEYVVRKMMFLEGETDMIDRSP